MQPRLNTARRPTWRYPRTAINHAWPFTALTKVYHVEDRQTFDASGMSQVSVVRDCLVNRRVILYRKKDTHNMPCSEKVSLHNFAAC